MLKKLITFPLLVVASLYIFIVEEFIWDPAVALLNWARKSSAVRSAESWMSRQKGWRAVTVLLVIPFISIEPVKVGVLYLMRHGHIYSGFTLFVVIKVVGTALFAQLYTLVGQECEKVVWFHWIAEKFRRGRSWVLSQKAYQEARAILITIKEKMRSRKSVLKHRLLAVIRYTRKQK